MINMNNLVHTYSESIGFWIFLNWEPCSYSKEKKQPTKNHLLLSSLTNRLIKPNLFFFLFWDDKSWVMNMVSQVSRAVWDSLGLWDYWRRNPLIAEGGGVKSIGSNPCGSLLKSLISVILRRLGWRSHSSKALWEWQNSSWDHSFFSWSPFLGIWIQIKTFPELRKLWNTAGSMCNPCFFLCISPGKGNGHFLKVYPCRLYFLFICVIKIVLP